jgi:GNAT superfamily N-acetyltransferase
LRGAPPSNLDATVWHMSIVRRALERDLPGIYRTCLQTGDSGADATALFQDPDLLGHIYTGPFAVREPDLAFVIVDEDGVGGYALAAADTKAFDAWAEENWWSELRREYTAAPRSGADGELIDLLFAPPHSPDSLYAEYPAQAHIDLTPRMRGHGHGRVMMQAVLDALGHRGVAGVHLDVSPSNTNAIDFHRHLGFAEVERSESSVYMGRSL